MEGSGGEDDSKQTLIYLSRGTGDTNCYLPSRWLICRAGGSSTTDSTVYYLQYTATLASSELAHIYHERYKQKDAGVDEDFV